MPGQNPALLLSAWEPVTATWTVSLSIGAALGLRPRSYLFGREHSQGATILPHGHTHLSQQGFPEDRVEVSRAVDCPQPHLTA